MNLFLCSEPISFALRECNLPLQPGITARGNVQIAFLPFATLEATAALRARLLLRMHKPHLYLFPALASLFNDVGGVWKLIKSGTESTGFVRRIGVGSFAPAVNAATTHFASAFALLMRGIYSLWIDVVVVNGAVASCKKRELNTGYRILYCPAAFPFSVNSRMRNDEFCITHFNAIKIHYVACTNF